AHFGMPDFAFFAFLSFSFFAFLGLSAGERVVSEAATAPVSRTGAPGLTSPESGPEVPAGATPSRPEALRMARSLRVACRSAPWARLVRESPARILALLPSHGARAAISSAGFWNRSLGFFASILAT